MNDILEKIAEAPSLPLLWRRMTRYYARNGFGAVSYYWVKSGTNMPATMPLQYGFSKKEVALYASFDFQRLDIVPRAALAAGIAIRWRDAWANTELTAEERAFLEAMQSIDFEDGYSLPCYGPGNRNAVVGLGKIKPDADLSHEHLIQMHFAAQSAHLRICRMFSEDGVRDRQLSAREKEILHWVARGKSNNVIAEILEISPGTVDTYMRRIYEKLEVSDRTSAAVKGVGMGLIAA
ncbi:MAG: LuxR family transcriptional regulator [Alphaproteobacteria bacterium]|nr:LuxR family transcriptional regulator [Alphaproteobacteria bacterium]MBU0792648.1 LuxR family transcriptional regulator [Alphaproteobacteria bacterium]MBU0875771.1 LuxR family transcriptional regulator [Alphaproteobacteria bacterium]MBU1769038.1 LuxR family transcriptional regulator [Alphaproteobacteria bacterium]